MKAAAIGKSATKKEAPKSRTRTPAAQQTSKQAGSRKEEPKTHSKGSGGSAAKSSGTTATKTTSHDEIKSWVEQRGGKPARVHATRGKNAGILRIDFGKKEDSLDTITWAEFFKAFEENNLAFLHQDKTASGRTSRFLKFVERD